MSWTASGPAAMLSRPSPAWGMPAVARSPAHATGQGVIAQREADGLFYVTAGINGHPVRFVVDTGSSIMVLSGDDAAAAGVALQGGSTAITTADGFATMNKAVVERVDFGPLALRDVPATVAAQGRVSLIGASILAQLQSVSIAGDRMELH